MPQPSTKSKRFRAKLGKGHLLTGRDGTRFIRLPIEINGQALTERVTLSSGLAWRAEQIAVATGFDWRDEWSKADFDWSCFPAWLLIKHLEGAEVEVAIRNSLITDGDGAQRVLSRIHRFIGRLA